VKKPLKSHTSNFSRHADNWSSIKSTNHYFTVVIVLHSHDIG